MYDCRSSEYYVNCSRVTPQRLLEQASPQALSLTLLHVDDHFTHQCMSQMAGNKFPRLISLCFSIFNPPGSVSFLDLLLLSTSRFGYVSCDAVVYCRVFLHHHIGYLGFFLLFYPLLNSPHFILRLHFSTCTL